MKRSNPKEPESLAEGFDSARSDYNAIRSSRFRRRRIGVASAGSGADFHYRSQADYMKLLEQARDFDRNDAIAGQTVERAVTNIIQQGFTIDPQTGDKGADQIIADRWAEWSIDADQVDLAGELNFNDMENLIPRQTFVDGDHIVLPNIEGPLELIEGHRLRTPSGTRKNVVHGVLLNERRKRLQYWFTKEDVSPMATVKLVGETTPFDARDAEGNRQVFHIYNPKRVSQTRGITAFAPIFDCLGMFEDINFARLIQQQVVSCFAIFRKRDATFQAGNVTETAKRGSESTDQRADGSSRELTGIGPGMEVAGEIGETLEGFSPNVPDPQFFSHVKLILTLVSINLGLPLNLLLLDPSDTNFSGWRGAMDQARIGFRRNQQWMISKFHRPVYIFKVRQWLSEDSALRSIANQSKVKIFRHRWNPPSWPYIEPLKDAAADLLRRRNCMISPRRQQAERGRDYNEVTIETIEDNSFAIKAAKTEAAKINKEFSKDEQKVHWRELYSAPSSAGVKITIEGDESEIQGTTSDGK